MIYIYVCVPFGLVVMYIYVCVPFGLVVTLADVQDREKGIDPTFSALR